MKSKYLGPVMVGLMVLLTLVVWPWLPDRIPTHWNIWGEVDDWSPKLTGAFIAPAIALALWLLLRWLPRLDPRRENYERFQDTYWLVVNAVIGFFGLIHVGTLVTVLGWPVDVPRLITVGLGLLLVLLGNYLPRVRPNWWMGIRTPWTLESDHVWRGTHRLAGKTFVAAGVIAVVGSLLASSAAFWIVMVAVGIAALVPVVYSYIIWRREQRGAGSDREATS